MTVYLFPGQGSQQRGMGGNLFDEFKELTLKADEILGYSIKELCIVDSENKLGETQYTQPALYVVNALSYLKKYKETNKKPDYIAGHSLGEYNALFAAEVFDFETGLRLVKKRGELMSKVKSGAMAAVIGLSEDNIKKVLCKNNLNTIDIANYNSPSQIVISGTNEDILRGKSSFEAMGAKMYIPLKVSGAFHSRYMTQVAEEFSQFVNQFEFNDIAIPVISNVSARPYKKESIKKSMVDQISNPVRWTETICYLMGKGEKEFIEIGLGNVISRLVESIQKEAEPLIINEQENIHNEKVKKKENSLVTNNSEETKSYEYNICPNNGQVYVTALSLGDNEFKKDYNLKYAYLAGGMYRGVTSKEMVVKLGKNGMMGFLGTGGLDIDRIEVDIRYIQRELRQGESYGMNLLHNPSALQKEDEMVDLFLKYDVKNVEASAYINPSPALVRYRLKGLKRNTDNTAYIGNKVMGKVSRPEIAQMFLSPAPEKIVQRLLEENKITIEQAELAKGVPMADDICVEADSGGHTDGGVAYTLMPALIQLRDEAMRKNDYEKKIRVGAAGGIGTPEAAAAAFMLGADFILVGSINQCTVEAGTSEVVKDMLQSMNVQDTEYAPAGDMFELGAKVQVLKKGLLFPARANRLYEVYKQYNSIDEIDEKTKKQIQDKYFKRSFDDVYNDVKSFYSKYEIEKAEANSKHKMALIFKWYFGYSSRLALNGDLSNKVDFQIHCGPALGAFNQWVKGTSLEDWRNRQVDVIGQKLLDGTAEFLNKRILEL